MTPLEVLRKYQQGRSLREYAGVLGISAPLLSQVYGGTRNIEGGQVIVGFLRAFPEAAEEMAAALGKTAQPASAEAVPA